MLLEKLFEVTVDVRDPVNFCSDKDRHLLTELRNTYNGRCFKGVFIVRVKSISQASACRLSMTNASGEGSIDVQFLADVVVFSRWDILVGVKVVNTQQFLVGEYKAPRFGLRLSPESQGADMAQSADDEGPPDPSRNGRSPRRWSSDRRADCWPCLGGCGPRK